MIVGQRYKLGTRFALLMINWRAQENPEAPDTEDYMEATTIDKRAIDRDLERLVHEIGEVIEKARPEEREELRQMATDLMQEEMVQTQVPPAENNTAAKRPLNLIALGAFVMIIGAGLSILMPPIGLLLVAAGLATLFLGTMYRMVTR
jgi:hypothetical protein